MQEEVSKYFAQHIQNHQHSTNKWTPSTEICARDITSTTIMDQNEKEKDICDQHLEKMLRKLYPGRQEECKNSSQHKIDHKIKEVNDHNGEIQEKENVTQHDRKAEN